VSVYGAAVNEQCARSVRRLSESRPDLFRYCGAYTPDQLPAILRDHHVGLLPSLFESYSLVLRELLSLGVPVVASRFHGSEIITDGVNGYLVPVGDARALAVVMAMLVREPERISQLQEGAAATPIMSMEQEVAQLLGFIRRLWGRRCLSTRRAPLSWAHAGRRRRMMAVFQVCIIMPSGYVHSMCFWELAVLLDASLKSLGHESRISMNRLDGTATNILLGYHLIEEEEALKGYRYIPYQLEQLGAEGGWYKDNVRQTLETATEVWDYSPDNIRFLGGLGIRAKLLQIGYHEALERIRLAEQRDIDVLFFGSPAERRQAVLDSLAASPGPRVTALGGVYGHCRDSFIARSKLVLNIHFYPTQILETVRISYLLNNRCTVVSEESAYNPYQGVPLHLVPYNRLVSECTELLSSPVRAARVGIDCHEAFRERYPMPLLLQRVL